MIRKYKAQITKYITIILSIFCYKINSSIALEDSLQKAIEIAGHGAKLQAERLKIIAENIANEDSVAQTPEESPYRRKIIFARNQYDSKLKTNVVIIDRYDYDESDFKIKYDPNHPAADEFGYVKYPNIQREIEKADSLEAQNSYNANINVIDLTKNMIQETLNVLK